jgi:NAD(P)-dependent dehydrogenase (short-subunit alcohol dehydrogenase family)
VRIAYGAMKAAVIALTRSIATTHGRHGIRANSIAPGLVLTPKIETVFPPAALAMIRAHQPLPWVTRPEDVADLAVFLASDESRCISGQTIVIDGGYSAAGPSTYELADLFGLGT